MDAGPAASTLPRFTRGAARAVARLARLAAARPWLPLCMLAIAPFVPGMIEFLRKGVPDILFTGDGGVLELRTWEAAHGVQLVGPYSRFFWSHPGPAFFYLALPFYAASGQHGPALNLATLFTNLAAAVALVIGAWRLRGVAFAAVTAALLAVYEMIAVPFPLSGEWNPMVPILPLALLTMLATRLATGAITALPVLAFVASAIVQTHLGFTPAVLFVSAVALVAAILRAVAERAEVRRAPRRYLWALGATLLVLALVWALPLYENATRHPGNLSEINRLFSSPHRPEHPWPIVTETVARKLAVMPAAAAGILDGVLRVPGRTLAWTLAIGQVAALLLALVFAVRRRAFAPGILAGLALGQIVVAVFAVRAIRGEINDYLVTWVSVLGLLSLVALAALFVPPSPSSPPLREVPATSRARRATQATVAASALLVLLAVRAGAGQKAMFRERDVDLERLAAAVETRLRAGDVDHPIVKIATHDRWPQAVAIVLHLTKQRIPVFLPDDWLFMFGPRFKSGGREHPILAVGSLEFAERMRGCPGCALLGTARDAAVVLQPAGALIRNRRPGPGRLLSATGTTGDPAVAVDGIVPVDGTEWSSPASVILTTTASAIEVAVPDGPLAGVFVSADGNDGYAVDCVAVDGKKSRLGSIPDDRGGGMQTDVIFSSALAGCRSVVVSPVGGDDAYSIGEIGFLVR